MSIFEAWNICQNRDTTRLRQSWITFPKDRVCLLSKVEFTNLATDTRMKFEIVSPH